MDAPLFHVPRELSLCSLPQFTNFFAARLFPPGIQLSTTDHLSPGASPPLES